MDFQRKQILCIDDDPSILQMYRFLLECSGFTTHTAANGRDGITILQSHPIDSVILDYVMNEIDGHSLSAEIRKIRPEIPLIMVSAHPNARESSSYSADVFIRKGDDPEVLLDVLKSVLEGRYLKLRKLSRLQ